MLTLKTAAAQGMSGGIDAEVVKSMPGDYCLGSNKVKENTMHLCAAAGTITPATWRRARSIVTWPTRRACPLLPWHRWDAPFVAVYTHAWNGTQCCPCGPILTPVPGYRGTFNDWRSPTAVAAYAHA